MTPDTAVLKEEAAIQALDEVKDGMVLGLGSGTTCNHFIELLGERLRQGTLHDVRGVPTSKFTAAQARRLGIPLTTLAEAPRLDLAIDGADEVDGDLNLIKGLGRSLLREKIVEVHASCFVVIVDETKLSPRLGLHEPLPVEVVPFEAKATERWLQSVATRGRTLARRGGVDPNRQRQLPRPLLVRGWDRRCLSTGRCIGSSSRRRGARPVPGHGHKGDCRW